VPRYEQAIRIVLEFWIDPALCVCADRAGAGKGGNIHPQRTRWTPVRYSTRRSFVPPSFRCRRVCALILPPAGNHELRDSGQTVIVEAGVTKRCTDMDETQDGAYGSEPILLLVDDDPLVRESLAEILSEGPYFVLTAGSGPEALDQLAAYPDIAVLITDIMMPGMDGLALAQAARAIRAGLQVLFLSGLRCPPASEEFLPKPVSALDLLSRVSRMMAERALDELLATALESSRTSPV